MRHTYGRIWNMARKLPNENEKRTWQKLEYGEKTQKMRHTHCGTWNMARNSEKREKYEIYTVGPGLW